MFPVGYKPAGPISMNFSGILHNSPEDNSVKYGSDRIKRFLYMHSRGGTLVYYIFLIIINRNELHFYSNNYYG